MHVRKVSYKGLAVLMASLALAGPLVAEDTTLDATPSLRVEIIDHAVSVRAAGITLERLLEEISLQSALTVEVDGVLDPETRGSHHAKGRR